MRFLFIFISLLSSQLVFGQKEDVSFFSQLNAGDGAGIVKFFDSNTDVSVIDEDESGEDASILVLNFFNYHRVNSFAIKHEGTSKLGDHYRIGILSTNKGEFRVTYFSRNNNSGYIIVQFKIEEVD